MTRLFLCGIALGLILVAQRGVALGQNEQAAVRQFSIIGHMRDIDDYRFNNSIPGPTLTVKEGDKVRIVFSVPDEDIAHALYIDELEVFSPTVHPGASAIIEFVADQKGEFIYYCPLPSQHRENSVVPFIEYHRAAIHSDCRHFRKQSHNKEYFNNNFVIFLDFLSSSLYNLTILVRLEKRYGCGA